MEKKVVWISEHIPRRSNISIDNFFLSRSTDKKRMLEFMTDCNTYYINDIIEAALKTKNCWYWYFKNESDPNCWIEIIEELDGHYDVLKCEDQNNTGSVDFQVKFNSAQNYGSIDFYIRTTDDSKVFYIEFLDKLSSQKPITLEISDAIYYYDGIKFQKIINIVKNMWYNVSIDFECSNGRYNGLIRYKWNFYVNGIKYGDYNFWNNISQLMSMRFSSSMNFFGWDFYFDDFNFSWAPDFNVENCIFLDQLVINYLERENIRYLILSEETVSENNSDKEYNILNDLISNFFIQKLYQYQGFAIYFAPN